MATLPYDILFYIFTFLDRKSLLMCCLVGREAKDIAKPALFRSVDLRHMDYQTDQDFTAFRQLDDHPQLRSYVREVEHFAPHSELEHIAPDADHAWINTLSQLENLTTYTLRSNYRASISSEFLTVVIEALKLKCPKLRVVNLDFFLYSYHVPAISLLSNLRGISLGRPSRTVLTTVGHWTDQFAEPLESLSIKSGAKVEPQMIPNILRHFSHLKRFTLGRNHKLTMKDLLYLIVNMPHLESLDIFYDRFLQGSNQGQPINTQKSRLNSLTVRHQGVSDSGSYCDLWTWLRVLVVDCAPPITSLTIIADDSRLCKSPHDFLAFFASGKRNIMQDLRVLRIPYMELKKNCLSLLLWSWRSLEVVEFHMGDIRVLDDCIKGPGANLLSPHLLAIRWTSVMKEKIVMNKVLEFVQTFDLGTGTIQRIGKEKAPSQWQGFWSLKGKEELVVW